jgi:BlaI family transcriptional regulator, penicillinase repressor
VKRPRHVHLTRRESQIMEIVHRRQRAAIEDIRVELPDAPSPSSVRKLLEIMIERGLLRREYDGPRYVYFPTLAREAARRSAFRHLLDTFFGGSAHGAMAALVEMRDTGLTSRQRRRLKELIEDAERKGR